MANDPLETPTRPEASAMQGATPSPQSSVIERQAKPPETSVKFGSSALRAHFARFHPNCPTATREILIARLTSRRWVGASIGMAVGIGLQNYVRHYMTAYDEYLRSDLMTRDEARAFVLKRVKWIIGSWGPWKVTVRYRVVAADDRRPGEPSPGGDDKGTL